MWTVPKSDIAQAETMLCCVVVDGKIQHRSIELGLRAGDDVEIKSGLDGSENVVLVRAGSLQIGQQVEIIVKK